MTQNVFHYIKKTRKLIQASASHHCDLITRTYKGRSTNYLPVSMTLCYYHENEDLTGTRHYGVLLVLDETGLSIFAEGITPVDFRMDSIRELSRKILKTTWHFCDAEGDSYIVKIVSGHWGDEEE